MSQSDDILDSFHRFTNRKKEIEGFQILLKALPNGMPPTLMYHGVGGAGKSWLLKKLQEECSSPSDALDVVSASFSFTKEVIERTPGNMNKFDLHRLLDHFAVKLETIQRRFSRYKLLSEALHELRDTRSHVDTSDVKTEFAQKAFDSFVNGLSHIPGIHEAVFGFETLKVFTEFGYEAWKKFNKKRLTEQHLAITESTIYDQLLIAFSNELGKISAKKRVVLFIDGFDVLRVKEAYQEPEQDVNQQELEKPYKHIWQLRQRLDDIKANNVLIVLAGCEAPPTNPIKEQDVFPTHRLIQVPINGFAEMDARDYLRKGYATYQWGKPSGEPSEDLLKAMLRVTEERHVNLKKHPPEVQTRHHCYALYWCLLEAIRQRKLNRGGHPPANIFDDIPAGAEAVEGLINRFLRGVNPRARLLLTELSMASSFDEQFAIDRSKQSGLLYQNKSGWNQITRLDVLQSRTGGFYGMHDVLRRTLQKRLANDEPRRFEFHAWALDHWINRAAEQSASGDHYIMEDAEWQERVSNSLYHLCRSAPQSDIRRASLRVSSMLIDLFWWWAESFSLNFWDELLETTLTATEAAAVQRQPVSEEASLVSNIEEFQKVITLLKELGTVWPKGLRKDPVEWDEDVREKWGPDTVAQWNWQKAHSCASQMKQILCPKVGIRIPTKMSADQQMEHRLAAMMDYYLAYADMHLAKELENKPTQAQKSGSSQEVQSHRQTAEAALRRHEKWFKKYEPEALKVAFAMKIRGELYESWGRKQAAKNAAKQALFKLKEVDAEEGACLECAGDAHSILSSLQARPQEAGKDMGVALFYGSVFLALDQDDYAKGYYEEQRACTQSEMQRRFSLSPVEARAYLQGIRAGWRSMIDFSASPADTAAGVQPQPQQAPKKPNFFFLSPVSEEEANFGYEQIPSLLRVVLDLPKALPSEGETKMYRQWVRSRLNSYRKKV